MEPQTPTQAGTPAGGQPNNLDPQVIKLADSIAQTESQGNSKAQGKSGEYGAYQWLPSTWEGESKAAGINVPLNQSTPEQQNEVAYKTILNYKNEGYTPAQIASIWNSGQPNAYLGTFEDGNSSEGTNGSNVQYNVPGYVSKVMNVFDGGQAPTANAATSQNNSTQSSSQPSFADALAGLGIGGLAWLGKEAINPLKDAATDAGVGAVAGSVIPGEGTVAGGITGGIAGLVEGIGQDIFGGGGNNNNNQTTSGTADNSENQSPQPDINTGDATGGNTEDQKLVDSAIAAATLKNGINDAIQSRQEGRIFSQSQAGQDAINTAAMFNLIGQDENGNGIFNEDARKEALKQIANLDDKVISADGGSASMMYAQNSAGKYIGNSRLNTQEDRDAAGQRANQILTQESGGNLNKSISLEQAREYQKQHNQKYKEGYKLPTSEILAHRAVAHAYGDMISNHLQSPEAQALHKKALKMEQDLIRSKTLSKFIQGKRIPKNKGLWEKFLRQGARAAEIYIGEKLGGPVGAIIGGLAGEHFNYKLTQHFGRNVFETPAMRAAFDVLRDTKPKEYEELVNALEKHGAKIPKEETKKPSNEEAKVKAVAKDEKIIKGIMPLKK